ncbi:MAG: hypothetical protein ABFS05_10025, partial [Bacteroidota bacterium]
MPAGRKKYSFYYRIYRRLRYLRYVKKLRKLEKQQIDSADKAEEMERNRIIREQRKANRSSEKEKRSGERQRRFRNRRRRRLFRLYARSCRNNTIKTIRVFNPLNLPLLFTYIRENRAETRAFVIISLHSTLLFTAAYFMIFLIVLLTSAISGLFFEYKSIIYHYEILWLVKPSQWFGDSVKMIYSSGPLLAGILAVFLAIIFSYVRTDKGLAKLFILWSFLHGFNAFFGSLLIGSLFGRGFGHAIIWSYISDSEKVIYSIVALTALFLIGVFTTKSFLISANSYYPMLDSRRYRSFIWAQLIVPFLLGNILIATVYFPEMPVYDMTVSLSLSLTIIPIALGYRFHHSMYFEEEEIRI